MAAPIFPMMKILSNVANNMCCSYTQQTNPIEQQKATILKCQNCGASEYDSNDDGKCDYCGTQIIEKRKFVKVLNVGNMTMEEAELLTRRYGK